VMTLLFSRVTEVIFFYPLSHRSIFCENWDKDLGPESYVIQ
jgi:hypothetical protein